MVIDKVFKFIVGQLPLQTQLKPEDFVQNQIGRKTKDWRRKVTELDSSIKILGKLCPCCGVAGSVFCETDRRIIYECWNGHQYETKKRLNRGSD
jgi:hypothetical protein